MEATIKNNAAKVLPYGKEKSKKAEIRQMFNNIAKTYDLLNRILSFGVDKLWRKKMVRLIKPYKPQKIIDLATGTGDMIVNLAKLKPQKIVGVDISEKMLEIAKEKIANKLKNSSIEIQFIHADCENLTFAEEQFDLATCVFGLRNAENMEKSILETYRILKPNGIFAILEFSLPESKIFATIYRFYFEKFLPFLGGLISKDFNAYKYLPESVKNFPYGQQLMNILKNLGFKPLFFKKLWLGVATIYFVKK